MNVENEIATAKPEKSVEAAEHALNAESSKQQQDLQDEVQTNTKNATEEKQANDEAEVENAVTNKVSAIESSATNSLEAIKDMQQTVESKTVKQPATNATDSVDSGSGSLSPPALMQSPQQQTTIVAATANETTIPLNILSPPKSEIQTDETNTATSLSSSSPNSDSQLSQHVAECEDKTKLTNNKEEEQPKTSSKRRAANTRSHSVANGAATAALPEKGKLLMSAVINRMNKTAARAVRARKQKAKVPLYESEISDHKIGIKLCIKKSDNTAAAGNATTTATSAAAAAAKPTMRKRARKTKTHSYLESDDSEGDASKRRKERTHNNNSEKRRKQQTLSNQTAAAAALKKSAEPIEQTNWGAKIPPEVLLQIFKFIVAEEGTLPAMSRMARVCSLWRSVSLEPTLWKHLDLTKCKNPSELKLKWLVDNRCSHCTDLNVASCKISDIDCFLHKLAVGCPNLQGINVTGWKNFSCDHLTFLVNNMKKLERLDLSSVNEEINASKSAAGWQSICNALQTMNTRLTHLHLAHNRLAGVPQIIKSLVTHCPNLVLLDLSNVTTQAISHSVVHIEKLQLGCPKLKVLRVTSSKMVFNTVTFQEQMDSPGFPDLEELSVATLTNDDARTVCDEHVQRILKTSSKLKLLDVRGCERVTHKELIRLPAWDLKHLFLSGCSITRDAGSGLELIASKWAHSLIELDLAWANGQEPLDNALYALAEKGAESPLAHLNLCGSSVSVEAVKEILANCPNMSSINLSSCRGLPRGIKRLMQGAVEINELREVLKVQMKVQLAENVKTVPTATLEKTDNLF